MEIWELVGLPLAARSGVLPSAGWFSSPLRAHTALCLLGGAHRGRTVGKEAGEGCTDHGRSCPRGRRGEGQAPPLGSEGRESHHGLSLPF